MATGRIRDQRTDTNFTFRDLAALCGAMLSDGASGLHSIGTKWVDSVAGIGSVNCDCILLLSGGTNDPYSSDSGIEEIFDDNGNVVSRNLVLDFQSLSSLGDDHHYLHEELLIMVDDDLTADSELEDNLAASAFANVLLESISSYIVSYLSDQGEVKFDIKEFPPRYGSSQSPRTPDPMAYDGQAVRVHLNQQCFDAVVEVSNTIARDAFVDFMSRLQVLDRDE